MPTVLVNLLQSTGTKGGIEIYARELYRQLGVERSDYNFVGFASRELAAGDTSWFPGAIVDSHISGENRFSWARGELLKVSQAATATRADLIHGPAMFAPLRSEIPVVVTVHDLLYFSHPELMRNRLLTGPVKWMEKRAARTASRMITISEYSARAIRTYLDFPEDLIDVIPLAGRVRSSKVTTRRTVPREADLFLSVGQRSPYKDFETVVRAWALIPAGVRPRLVITGSHGADPLAPLVAGLGLEKWVHLESWIPASELESLFDRATVLIDSTLASGFSMPTLESMNVGLPVLLADTDVFREVGGDAAEYFTAGDPFSLADAVQLLGADAERRAALSARGLTRAEGFSWSRVAQQTLQSFDLALGRAS